MTQTGITYQIYSFVSEELKQHEGILLNTINKGYNVPRFQFNVITTPRIKHSVIEDLCVSPVEESIAIFAFADAVAGSEDVHIDNDETVDDAAATKEKLLQIYPKGSIDYSKSVTQYDTSVSKFVDFTSGIHLPADFTKRFLGMGCLKPHGGKGSYELTGFISFYPGAGTQVLNTLESFAKDVLHAHTIWITAIEEHLLGKMYEKFGYVFVERVLVPVSAENDGMVDNTGGHLENDIGASQDFHLEVMSKTL